ncbi:MAG: cytochrome c-type biogenesis CcmF C-terminal domain-containing protein [Anaerolineae bacterium]
MLGDLGSILTGLALAATTYGAGAAVVAIQRRDRRWWESARNALRGAAVLLAVAILTLAQAFLSNDFSISYVAQHSSRALPAYLQISSIWAGQEGSLLLWSLFQAIFSALAISRPTERDKALVPWATVILSVVGIFFIGVTLFLSNPFAQLAQIPADGQGLNPLLRHPGMIFHPPAMYVGYVGLSVPFAFALAALITNTELRWTTVARNWTLTAWLGLGLGLLLGMRWAYDVLGWGGYWGWDPVENAGLMPWLTTTALLHGAVMQDERRGFRIWNYALVILSFVLVLFGTFATRSGLIQSVHAYAVSPLGGYFLGAILVSLGVSVALIVWRYRDIASKTVSDSLLTRDGLFFLTLVIFSTLTVSVFVGSVLPTLTDVISGQQFEAGPEWFDRVTGPQFGALVLLIGICPLVGRAASATRRVKKWGWATVLGAAVAVVAGLLSGFQKPVSLIGFALAGLAAATVLIEYGEGVSKRLRQSDDPPLNALWHLIRQQRRKYGGYLVHLGIILMAVGVVGTRVTPFEQEVVMVPGQITEVGDYTLMVDPLSQERLEDHVRTWATVSVYRDAEYLATLEPSIKQYVNYPDSYSEPALRPGIREDLYLILAGWGRGGTTVTLKVVVNALANFLWLGGLVFLAGGSLALWPRGVKGPWNGVAALALIVMLLLAGWSMWGSSHGLARNGGGRPLVGQEAPGFRLALLDGGAVSLEELRGQVTVLNFWAPWCPTCKDDLPLLEGMWQDYRGQGVTFVGAAYQSEPAEVGEGVETYGLSYAVGADVGDRIADAYGVTKVPETFVIDAEGRVVSIHIGPLSEERLGSELTSLLGGE